MANQKKAAASKRPARTAKPAKSKPAKSRRALVVTKAPRKAAKAAPSGEAAVKPRPPKPFVKWAGGKRQLLGEIRRHIPADFGTYHEPFLGGGAVFFALPPGTAARLSDLNLRLVRTYRGIQTNVGKVIDLLNGYRRERDFFEKMRQRDIDKGTDVEVAAWFIFLNKTGFNGLYRVNSKNQFNVPFGAHTKNARFFDEANLRACSESLQSAQIEHQDFEQSLAHVKKGDVVYFDPPYVPLSSTANFTSYTAERFGEKDQERLRDAALTLKKLGAHVILSNSSSAAHLYDEAVFSTKKVLAARPVNSKGDRRGKIAELLIT
ncbi:MAG TPA: DNA adenine methylase [Polyangia bacterium]|jgi:DNA adenine methylase